MNYSYIHLVGILLLSILVLFLLPACQQAKITVPEGFHIHPDFTLELVASEPLVFDPVDMEFDEDGRAFVLEMPGYPLRDENSRLILLKDENGDGLFDKRQVYADSLHLASSFLPYKGGMLVASPPYLLYLKDENGDEVADTRQVLMEGFAVGNLQHNYNGLSYGLDNWIYAANGGNSGTPFYIEDSTHRLPLRGEDFRFRVEEKLLERVGESSGGFELAFDNWGRMYETHNLEHVSQLVFEGKYIEGLPVSLGNSLTLISDHEENGLARIYPIGEQDTRVNHPEQSGYFSGSCGITFYGGGLFPEGFNNNIFVADVVLNLIHMDVLSSEGTHSIASRKRDKSEFLASSDRSFRPVNLSTGPDGALYVLDMHRAVIEHPEWIPDEIEKNMNLGEGKGNGRIYRIMPKNETRSNTLGFDKSDNLSLLQALGNENQWRRITAQRILVARGQLDIVPQLEELIHTSTNEYTRLHALWTLDGLGRMSEEILLKSLKDPSSGIRENALRVAETYLIISPEFGKNLIPLCKDKDARVRMRAALALGRLPKEYIASSAQELFDAFHYMLKRKDADSWHAMATASAMQHQSLNFSLQFLNQANGKIEGNYREALLTLCRMIGKEQSIPAIEVVIKTLAGSKWVKRSDKGEIIAALAEGWGDQKGKGSLTSAANIALGSLEKSLDPGLLVACGKFRKALALPVSPSIQSLMVSTRESIFDESKTLSERKALLSLLGLDDFSHREETLYRLLDSKQSIELQQEAMRQLWLSDDDNIGTNLIANWTSLGPESRKNAGNILLYKSSNHELLLDALEANEINVGELNFDLERRRVLLWSEDEKIKDRAEHLFSDAGVVQRKEAMGKMKPALNLMGSVSKGKKHFKALCASCHQYGNMGKEVGPNLTEINRKSKASLMHDILDPNAAVDSRYISHQIRTAGGMIHTGIIYRESDASFTLRMIDAKEAQIDKKEIASLRSMGISLMPEGLESEMDVKDFADLLAFLQQQP